MGITRRRSGERKRMNERDEHLDMGMAAVATALQSANMEVEKYRKGYRLLLEFAQSAAMYGDGADLQHMAVHLLQRLGEPWKRDPEQDLPEHPL